MSKERSKLFCKKLIALETRLCCCSPASNYYVLLHEYFMVKTLYALFNLAIYSVTRGLLPINLLKLLMQTIDGGLSKTSHMMKTKTVLACFN